MEKMAIQQAEHSVELVLDQRIELIGGCMFIDELREPNFVRSGSDWYKASIDDVGDLLLNDVPHDQVPQL